MEGLDRWFFGFREILADGGREKLCRILLEAEIRATLLPDGRIILKQRDFKKFKSKTAGKVRYTSSGVKGLPGKLRTAISHKGFLIGIFLSLLLWILSSFYVWDVRVDGNEALSDSQVVALLGAKGLDIGMCWSDVDEKAVEARVLAEFDPIAWISIYRVGTVAYVDLVERGEESSDSEESTEPCNIVASFDGVIEQITVKRGTPMVKPGDVVRKGDVLISGVITQDGSVRYVKAEGYVIGESATEVITETQREEAVQVAEGKKLVSVDLILLKYITNIFKNYRNPREECDIIEEKEQLVLFGRYRTPFGIRRTYSKAVRTNVVVRDETELIKLAWEKHRAALVTTLRSKDLLKIKTEGAFCDSGYRVVSRLVYSADISEEMKIFTEENGEEETNDGKNGFNSVG